MTWQPMETCPRDGTAVLFYRNGCIGFGQVRTWRAPDGSNLSGEYFTAAWVEDDAGERRLTMPSNDREWPTHWRPMVDPPALR